MGPPVADSMTLDALIVVASMAREKTTVGWMLVATPVADAAGFVWVTVGGVGVEVAGITSIAATSGSSTEPYTDFTDRVPFVTCTPLTVLMSAVRGPTAAQMSRLLMSGD